MKPWNSSSAERNRQPRCSPQDPQFSTCHAYPGNQLQYVVGSPETTQPAATLKHPMRKRRPCGLVKVCVCAPPTATRADVAVIRCPQDAQVRTDARRSRALCWDSTSEEGT